MTKYARLSEANAEGDRHVIDLVDRDPAHIFHPTIAADFISAPNETTRWSTKNGATWTHHDAPEEGEVEEPTPAYSKSMTPIRFKLALGQAARLAIRQAVAYEGADAGELTKKAILGDWWDILNDPTLVSVSVEDPDTVAALGYLVSIGVLTEAEQDDILLGVQA